MKWNRKGVYNLFLFSHVDLDALAANPRLASVADLELGASLQSTLAAAVV